MVLDFVLRFLSQYFRRIPRQRPRADQLEQVKFVAHRGCWKVGGILENSLAAFDRALQLGLWGIEFDLRWSKDNFPFIFHDPSMKRLFQDSVRISELNRNEILERFPLIPKLETVVKKYGGKIHLMIELKERPSEGQAKTLQQLLHPLQPIHDFHFMSLDLDHFLSLTKFTNQTFVSIARINVRTIFKETLKRKLGGFTGHYLLVKKNMIEKCHQQGISVGTGFPDSPNLLFREMHRQVDWIFSNDCEILQDVKNNSTL